MSDDIPERDAALVAALPAAEAVQRICERIRLAEAGLLTEGQRAELRRELEPMLAALVAARRKLEGGG